VEESKKLGLALLRKEFDPNQISKLPKPSKSQTDEVKSDYRKGIRCQICGGWHHKDVVHLDYVGHAALTNRLLDCDESWFWEPVAFDQQTGLPKLDSNGGLWIRLTVCGVTRLGYGHPDGKSGGDAIKESIGDALRNAAMRFGAALDLWHKGDLHLPQPETKPETKTTQDKKIVFLTVDQQTELSDLMTQANADKAGLMKYLSDSFSVEITSLAETPITAYKQIKSLLLQKIEKAKS